MGDKIYRCYVEKRPGYDIAAKALQAELSDALGLQGVGVRIFNRYDVQGLTPDAWTEVVNTVLSEPMSDICYEGELPPLSSLTDVAADPPTKLLYVEPLPGQFDIRADSCEQCVQMLLGGGRPVVRTATVYAVSGIDEAAFGRVKAYIINPLECREASAELPDTLLTKDVRPPEAIPVIKGFSNSDDAELDALREGYGLAMSLPDLGMVRGHFKADNREPTVTELRVLDTYWSDHCRHTTFNTVIEQADIQDGRVKRAYDMFLSVNGEKPATLMNIATAAMRHLRAGGELPMLDESDENNACTIGIVAEFERGWEDWLLFFKNETHNHPTEIEPYGGASTCIGGAIRDPLSGRAYVYQGMRISGAGDPRTPIAETLPGKLPQRRLATGAAAGFSAYGNQIGLATGYVREIYHEGYVAKRLEAGAVIGAAPRSSVRRESPEPGDLVVLLGGRTGRDGIGGATGSSKTHEAGTVAESASEVQKGNAPEERKLQRLFRNPEAALLIKRCNDFGAGGAAVAIGELADGVEIDLDAMPTKYDGLDGTELAISESQERMALVVAERDLPALMRHAESENIEASVVAKVTESKRLVMKWRGQRIVDIDRAFLDTNGAERRASVYVPDRSGVEGDAMQALSGEALAQKLMQLASDLNICSQKGLVERFDGSIGAASVFMPFGGKHALTESQVMAALLPSPGTRTASVMAYGFDPYLTEADPFAGSANAVVTSVAKLVASGAALDTIHLSLQEYFPNVGDDAGRWGLPFAAMLGAFSAQMGLGIAAIGGKDSMSGSFGELDVPPTLISFAVGVGDAPTLTSPEFKDAGHPVYIMEAPVDADGLTDFAALRDAWKKYAKLMRSGKVLSAWACEAGGVHVGIMKMALGNMIGFAGDASGTWQDERLCEQSSRLCGSIIFETAEALGAATTPAPEGDEPPPYRLLGHTQAAPELRFGENNEAVPLEKLREAWESTLEGVFPVKAEQPGEAPKVTDDRRPAPRIGLAFARPRAVIPVFPGTNCEYDTAAAIERAGGVCETVLVRNLRPDMLEASIVELEKAIASSQMIVFPGGFSGGDEPDGSGKFIVSLFRSERLKAAVHDLLQNRDGLVLGICNGFQALIKMGLLPYGCIAEATEDWPTLAFNRIGRHQSLYVTTRVASTLSPWLSRCVTGELHSQPVSHGEGRFTASAEVLADLRANGQIAFQYADHDGLPSMDIAHNPNGSDWAIEGICSPDGRILGKMAHAERHGENVAKNVPGNKFLPLFEGGVDYFR
ncbi:MAG: phosphoribosylformylglycinamidine synthase [Clostridiales bacterium]|nr:phosphoribosylformylglycinamidine synthase [Clostridiales bacterium]